MTLPEAPVVVPEAEPEDDNEPVHRNTKRERVVEDEDDEDVEERTVKQLKHRKKKAKTPLWAKILGGLFIALLIIAPIARAIQFWRLMDRIEDREREKEQGGNKYEKLNNRINSRESPFSPSFQRELDEQRERAVKKGGN